MKPSLSVCTSAVHFHGFLSQYLKPSCKLKEFPLVLPQEQRTFWLFTYSNNKVYYASYDVRLPACFYSRLVKKHHVGHTSS